MDLYQIHRWDDQTPIEETMAALTEEEVARREAPYRPHPVLGPD